MNTYRGRRVETEWGVTYVPVDPKTELPEYIVDAAWSLFRHGRQEEAEAVRNWIEETQNINATYTQWHPREVPGQTLLYHLTRLWTAFITRSQPSSIWRRWNEELH